MRCDDVYNKQFLKKMKIHTSKEYYRKMWTCVNMMIVWLMFINNREVFGIRSSIPRNSNAELKKQMVTINDH